MYNIKASGRFVIDVFAYTKFNPYIEMELEPLEIDANTNDQSTALAEEKLAGRLSAEQLATNIGRLEKLPKYLMLISPFLPAFALKSNDWCKH